MAGTKTYIAADIPNPNFYKLAFVYYRSIVLLAFKHYYNSYVSASTDRIFGVQYISTASAAVIDVPIQSPAPPFTPLSAYL